MSTGCDVRVRRCDGAVPEEYRTPPSIEGHERRCGMAMQRWTWSRAGWVPVGTPLASLPSASTLVVTETDKPAGWFRRLRRRREILGLTVTEAALLTGISPRTLTHAEIDDDYTPS